MVTDTVMTISCCLAWTLFCICVRRRCPMLLTVVRKRYWPTETISTQVCCVRLHREEKPLVLRFAGARRRSENKHAGFVFTGEWRPGDYEQLWFFTSGGMSRCQSAEARWMILVRFSRIRGSSVFAIPTEWTTAKLEGGTLSLPWAGATASFTLYSSRGRPLHISMAPSA